MSTFSRGWLDSLVRELNGDEAFSRAARWFDGSVALVSGEESLWLGIQNGEVKSAELGLLPEATFTLSGLDAAWRELFSPETVNGTINRLFRQGSIRIEGDLVKVGQFWKVIFWIGEVGKRVPMTGPA